MRIIFLCGSLEPGRDGVGDYTRRLASELICQGHQVGAVAFNDRQIQKEFCGDQELEGIKLPVLRIPSGWPEAKRCKRIKEWIKNKEPEWLSLQYVPYGFSEKGVPIFIGKKLSILQSSAKWHVMVHEPYLGAEQKHFKNSVIRLGQKVSLKFIKKHLHPLLFHTSNFEYQRLLSNISIESRLLGLFGNIKIDQGLQISAEKFKERKSTVLAVYFGAAPALEHHEIFSREIYNYCQLTGHKIELYFCGKSGELGEEFLASIKRACNGNVCEVVSLGFLPFEELSKLFLKSDFGIARVPPKFLGKSGAAISMLEHGLPLWVPLADNDNFEDHFDFRPKLCFRELKRLGNYHLREPSINRLPEVASKMIADLS